jgi:hypothetical protein
LDPLKLIKENSEMDSNTNGGSANQQGSQQSAPAVDQGIPNDVPQSTGPNLGAVRKSGQQEVLQALSKVAGVDFSKTKDAVKFVESLAKQNNGGSGKASKGSSNGGEIGELRNMIQSLQEQVVQKDQAVRRTSLQSNIKETAIKAGFDPGMLDIATGLFENQLDYDETGNFFVKGANGSVKLDSKGNPYTLDALAQDILRSRPKLAADEGRSGSGSRFGAGVGRNDNDIPDASTDLEGWKLWKERQGIGGRSLKGMNVSINKPIV